MPAMPVAAPAMLHSDTDNVCTVYMRAQSSHLRHSRRARAVLVGSDPGDGDALGACTG